VPDDLNLPPLATTATCADDPATFADQFLPPNEKGLRWEWAPYQRIVLAQMFAHPYRARLWSEPKKSGKTFLAAVLGLWWAFTHARTEVIVCARISASYQRSALPLPTPPPRARRRGIIRAG